MSLKNPVTPPGIDPGTVRLVAQHLNHYSTPGPHKVNRAGCNSRSNSEPEALYINVGLIHSGHGLLCIDGKSNKLQKKEGHFLFTEIGC